jgi:hypothetical protein
MEGVDEDPGDAEKYYATQEIHLSDSFPTNSIDLIAGWKSNNKAKRNQDYCSLIPSNFNKNASITFYTES